MILQPAILALLIGSVFVVFMALYAGAFGVQILRRWDIRSGSEIQLGLERKTYLVSTVLVYVFGFELLSFFLFIYTVDGLHDFFPGAMCAAGSLNADPFGYPTLLVKLVNFLLIGVWLVINRVDREAEDYPLIRAKYKFFLALVPLLVVEAVLQAVYFLRLDPNVITSCCATIFSRESGLGSAVLTGAARVPTMAAFYGSMLLTVAAGVRFRRKGRGGRIFSASAAVTFVVSIVSIFSFISIYIYELPTHHCPFCMLQAEYGFIGYPLYAALLPAAIFGLGVGALMPFRNISSLAEIVPAAQRRLATWSSTLYLTFAVLVTVRILLSDLRLGGY